MASKDIITRLKLDSSQHDQALQKSKRNLQSYGSAANSMSKTFGSAVQMVGKYFGAISAGAAALKVASDAFVKAETNVDNYNRTIEGAKGAYESFCATLRNGDWGNFLTDMKSAISSAKELYDTLDELGTYQLATSVDYAQIDRDRAQNKLSLKKGDITQEQYDAQEKKLADRENWLINREKNLLTNSSMQSLFTGGELAGVDKGALQSLFSGNLGIKTVDDAKKHLQEQEEALERVKALRKEYKKTHASFSRDGTLSSNDPTINAFDAQIANIKQKIDALNYLANPDNFAKATEAYRLQQQAFQRETQILRNQTKGYKETTSSKSPANKGDKWSMMSANVGGIDMTTDSIKDIKSRMSEMQSIYETTGDAQGRAWAKAVLDGYKAELDAMNGQIPGLAELNAAATESIQKAIKENSVADTGKELKDDWTAAAKAISSVGSALQGIEDPAVKVTGILAQAVATIALSYAEAMKMAATTTGPWGWIAFGATGLATMLSSISAVKDAGKFAEGGTIGGSSFSGDRLIAHVNSGESILSRKETANAMAALDAASASTGGNVRPYVTGDMLYLGINNHLRSIGKGELVTTR